MVQTFGTLFKPFIFFGVILFFFLCCVQVRLASLRSQHEKNEEIKKRKDEAKWTVNSPPVVGGALNGLGWWPNQNECILYTSYPSSTFIFFLSTNFCFLLRRLSSRQKARHHEKMKKQPFRMGEYKKNGEWGRGTIAAGYASRTTEKWVSKPGRTLLHYKQDSNSKDTNPKVPYLSSFSLSLSLSCFFIFSFFFLVGSFRLDMATPHVTVGLLQHSVSPTWWWWWRGFRVVPCQMQRFTAALFSFAAIAMTRQPRRPKRRKEWRNITRKGEEKKMTSAGERPESRPFILVPDSFWKFVVKNRRRKKQKKKIFVKVADGYDTRWGGGSTRRHSTPS